MPDYYFSTEDMAVGYGGRPLISEINLRLKKGGIMTLIGPNGSGKSTILKSVTRHLAMLSGVVYIDNNELTKMSGREMAVKMAVVLTERVKPELMTCGEVVALGRYPYTNHFGRLTPEDAAIVDDSLEKVNALDLKDNAFDAISDGQRQRVMLARAICQRPEIIVLDEPTSYLDIRYKIELLEILKRMSKDSGITIVMSLHEIDLAQKISDIVVCVKGERITKFGTPEEIFTENIINELYGISGGAYDLKFGSVELSKPGGEPETFVLAGGGSGIPFFRILQRNNIPFYTGILFDNDIDYQVSRSLAARVFCEKAFTDISTETFESAAAALEKCDTFIHSGVEIRAHNRLNGELFERAKGRGLKIITDITGI